MIDLTTYIRTFVRDGYTAQHRSCFDAWRDRPERINAFLENIMHSEPDNIQEAFETRLDEEVFPDAAVFSQIEEDIESLALYTINQWRVQIRVGLIEGQTTQFRYQMFWPHPDNQDVEVIWSSGRFDASDALLLMIHACYLCNKVSLAVTLPQERLVSTGWLC